MPLNQSSIDDIAALKKPKTLYRTLLSHGPEYTISIIDLLEVVYWAIKYKHCDLLVFLKRKENQLLKQKGCYGDICSAIKMAQTKDNGNCDISCNTIVELHYSQLYAHDFPFPRSEMDIDEYLERFGSRRYWQENLLPDMCSRGHYRYVRHIFENHPQMIRLTNPEGDSVLDLAVKASNNIFEYLLEQKAPVTHMTFLYACGLGYRPIFEIYRISEGLPEIFELLLTVVESGDNIQRGGCDFFSHNCFNSSNPKARCGIAKLSPENRYPINMLCREVIIRDSPSLETVLECISKLAGSSIPYEFLFKYSFCLTSMVSSLFEIDHIHRIIKCLGLVMKKSKGRWCTLLEDKDSVQLIERYICPQDERNENYNWVARRFPSIPWREEQRCLNMIYTLLINKGNKDPVWDDLYIIMSELIKLGAKPTVDKMQIPRLVDIEAFKLATLQFSCLSIPDQIDLIQYMTKVRKSAVEDKWIEVSLKSSLSLKYQAMHAVCANLKGIPIYCISKLELPTVLRKDIVIKIY